MKKLGSKKQIALYAVSGMGVNLLNTMMTSYLCSALIIGGFGDAAIKNQTYLQRDLVDAAIWGAFVLIAKIIDGIIDVPMAALTDDEKKEMAKNARHVAEIYDFKNLTNKLIEIIESR